MSTRVVVASGYFNPLHYGHVNYLQKAKDLGTSLLVIVYNDEQATLKMGSELIKDYSSIPARDRVRLVRSLKCVDLAIESIDQDDSVAETIRLLHPDVFASCGNKLATPKEAAVCNELGVQMIDGLGIEVLLLEGFTQHYDWGKPRGESAVAALAGQAQAESPKDKPGKKGKPFAELWMGDHPSGPSTVKSPHGTTSGCLMSTFKTTPNVLGKIISKEGSLPFLMKVLSIEKALSIQAHPDRGLAAKLHKERPDVYKDANHKPEIAIALESDFEALCGFRPVQELAEMVDHVPELLAVIGGAAAQRLRDAVTAQCETEEAAALKSAFTTMIRSTGEEASALIRALVERACAQPPSEGHPEALAKAFKVVIRLHEQFGEDIGVFCPFFLNYVQMDVGECLYMPQNSPHAYLSGDIVECMACSDNVVRAALTPKLKDLDVLCEMLDYRGGKPPSVKAQQIEDDMKLYKDLDIEEFQVTHLRLEKDKKRRYCFSRHGPALGFAWRGSGTLKISGESMPLAPGVVFFLSAGVDVDFFAEVDLDCFIACCPSHYFQRKTSDII